MVGCSHSSVIARSGYSQNTCRIDDIAAANEDQDDDDNDDECENHNEMSLNMCCVFI